MDQAVDGGVSSLSSPQEASPQEDSPQEDSPQEAFLGVTRSLSGKKWRLRTADDRAALAMAQKLEIPEIVARLLVARGVTAEEGRRFLNPTLRDALPDPSTLKDMDAAAARLARAVREGEGIAVFGDYDVDGATSAALLQRFFTAIGGDIRVYIPDRMKEGYGPNACALKKLRAEGAALVVTVDCGISAFEPLAEAARIGLEAIVVDHHKAEPQLPQAVAVVNPNRLDESGALGHLAAVGVAYLLVIAVNRVLRQSGWYDHRPEPDLLQWLDLVALGTVCDVVPLTGLNRALVAQGLKVMARRANTGLAALADVSGVKEKPGTYHAGFLLGPRINAGGRIGHADYGARLLATGDKEEAARLARELDEFNAERQRIEAAVLDQAFLQAQSKPGAFLMIASKDWHPGVIGIVAGRLKERLNKPVFVCAIENGQAKGSGRSIPGVDLGSAIIAARQAGLLVNGGGHAMAAGLTVETARLGELEAFLSERIEGQMADLDPVPELGLDGALTAKGATAELAALIERAGPFGLGNAEPRFVLVHARVVKPAVAGKDHVRCFLTGDGGGRLKAIAFRSLDTPLGRALLENKGETLHVAGRLRADSWQGRDEAQFFIDDAATVADSQVE